jgi:hypothetical protein
MINFLTSHFYSILPAIFYTISVIMLLLFLVPCIYIFGVFIGSKFTEFAKSNNFWESLILTIYIPVGWFASVVLVRILQHFLKG